MTVVDELAATPDPAVTDWVPMWNLGGSPLALPSTRVYRNAAQAIPHATWTAVAFNAVRYDNGGQWASGAPTRLTCQLAGTYVISGHCQFAPGAGGQVRQVLLQKNGSVIIGSGGFTLTAVGASGYPVVPTPTVVQLAAGDYVEMLVYQDSGAALNLQPGDNANQQYQADFSMALVAGAQGPRGDPGANGAGVPQPVVNGQWIKGVGGAAQWQPIKAADMSDGVNGQFLKGTGGAAIWAALAQADIPGGIPASKLSGYPGSTSYWLRGDGSWATVLAAAPGYGAYSYQVGSAHFSGVGVGSPSSLPVTFPYAWPGAHVWFDGKVYPGGHWDFNIMSCWPNGPGGGVVWVRNGSAAQAMDVQWVSIGY